MISKEFRGHRLSNAASAIAIYYPRIANGGDIYADLRKKDGGIMVLLNVYAAFRMAGDPEARKMKPEDIIDEVSIFDSEVAKEFNEVMIELLNEGKGNPKKG